MKEDKCKRNTCDMSQYPINERIGFQVSLLSCAMKAKKNRDFESIDLTSSQADVLGYVARSEREGRIIQQVDVERRFNLSNPTVTGIIQRMEAKGFITREVSTTDKRCKYLHTTKQTEELHKYAEKKRKETHDLLTQDFTETEKEELYRLLEKALSNIRSKENVEEN